MAAGSYGRVNVKCPFYRYDTRKPWKITCEGMKPKSTISQVWERKRGFEKQLEQFCCECYEECAVYKMIMSEKYTD